MPCYNPLIGYVSRKPNESGKYPVTFKYREGWIDRKVSLPCGKCIGCKLDRSRQWATRCMHEASLHDNNCFITLTYDDAHLPKNGSLDKSHFQNFMKRLRKMVEQDRKFKKMSRKIFGQDFREIKYLMCGEYGSENQRPHYHACLFGVDFPDRLFTPEGNYEKVFSSKFLSKLWRFGFSCIGDITFKSAAYVARYCLKKVDSPDISDGRVKEYILMSRGGRKGRGLGFGWIDKFSDDVYCVDKCILPGGFSSKPPRYYDEKYSLQFPEDMIYIKQRRIVGAKHSPDNTPARLRVREKVAKLNASQFRREL